MWRHDFVSFDTETTGFGPDARILEIAVSHWHRGELLRTWSTFLDPTGIDFASPGVKQALAINHIDPAMLVGAPAFADVADKISEELGSGVYVAHNFEFDERMLKQEWARIARSPPWWAGLPVCTYRLAQRLDNVGKYAKGYKLGEVAGRLGIAPSDAHRAGVDAETCGRVLLALGERVPARARELGAFMGIAA